MTTEKYTDSNELRLLAAGGLTTFVFPPDEDSFFLPLTEATARLPKPYAEICLTLRSTLSGLLSAVSMPYTMANRSAHDRHWQRIFTAAGIRSLMLDAKQQKLTRSRFDLKMRAEVERLIAEGRMPPLEKVLAAVEETRKKYRQRILDARKPVR